MKVLGDNKSLDNKTNLSSELPPYQSDPKSEREHNQSKIKSRDEIPESKNELTKMSRFWCKDDIHFKLLATGPVHSLFFLFFLPLFIQRSG